MNEFENIRTLSDFMNYINISFPISKLETKNQEIEETFDYRNELRNIIPGSPAINKIVEALENNPLVFINEDPRKNIFDAARLLANEIPEEDMEAIIKYVFEDECVENESEDPENVSKHYKKMKLDVFAIIKENQDFDAGLGFVKYNILKYAMRSKGQDLDDFEKIKVYADFGKELLRLKDEEIKKYS